MQDFKCVTEAISEMKTLVDEIQELLDSTYTKASEVFTAASNSSSWNGDAQKAGVAFLDLTMQYHAKLAGGEVSGPVMQASEDLQKYLDSDGTFYDEWPEYQDLSLI